MRRAMLFSGLMIMNPMSLSRNSHYYCVLSQLSEITAPHPNKHNISDSLHLKGVFLATSFAKPASVSNCLTNAQQGATTNRPAALLAHAFEPTMLNL